jgi:hypothetical protein
MNEKIAEFAAGDIQEEEHAINKKAILLSSFVALDRKSKNISILISNNLLIIIRIN